MVVLDPLLIEIENYPKDKSEILLSDNHPMKPEEGKRELSFSSKIYIEKSDFMEDPPGKFFRLAPGREVRLRNAYIIKCERIEKNENDEIEKIICSYDEGSKTGGPTAARKVKGTLHWVDVNTAVKGVVRHYDYLLNEDDGEKKDYMERINENSLKIYDNAMLEPEILNAKPAEQFQFMRQGYYACDKDFTKEKPLLNLIVGLRDSFSKTLNK